MQRLEVSGAVRPIYGSLGVKRLTWALAASEWYTSCPSRFNPEKEPQHPLKRRLGGTQSLPGQFEGGKRCLAPAGFEDRTVQSLYRLLHSALHKMLPYSAVTLHQYIACRHVGDSSSMHISWGLYNKPTHISA